MGTETDSSLLGFWLRLQLGHRPMTGACSFAQSSPTTPKSALRTGYSFSLTAIVMARSWPVFWRPVDFLALTWFGCRRFVLSIYRILSFMTGDPSRVGREENATVPFYEEFLNQAGTSTDSDFA
jgi:hypothetical protein